LASSVRITVIVCASVVIVTGDVFVDTAGFWVTVVVGTGVKIAAVNSVVETSSLSAASVFCTGVVVVAFFRSVSAARA